MSFELLNSGFEGLTALGTGVVERCRVAMSAHPKPKPEVGLQVQGSGFRVQGSGFRVQGLGFRVQGLGFRVQGSGFRVQGSGFRV